jgi:hypothetical protein
MNTEPSVCCLGNGCSTARAGLSPALGRKNYEPIQLLQILRKSGTIYPDCALARRLRDTYPLCDPPEQSGGGRNYHSIHLFSMLCVRPTRWHQRSQVWCLHAHRYRRCALCLHLVFLRYVPDRGHVSHPFGQKIGFFAVECAYRISGFWPTVSHFHH